MEKLCTNKNHSYKHNVLRVYMCIFEYICVEMNISEKRVFDFADRNDATATTNESKCVLSKDMSYPCSRLEHTVLYQYLIHTIQALFCMSLHVHDKSLRLLITQQDFRHTRYGVQCYSYGLITQQDFRHTRYGVQCYLYGLKTGLTTPNCIDGFVWFLVFNATFSNISAISW